MKQLLVFVLSTTFFFSCGGNTTSSTVKDTSSAKSNDEAKSTGGNSCCFQTEEEFKQFLPAECGEVKEDKPGYASNLNCLKDPEDNSSATKIYVGPDGTRLSLQLRDYCAKRDRIQEDYNGRADRSKNDPVEHEYNEHTIAGVDKCYSHYSPKNKTVYVLAVIDGRFRVQITGQQATSANYAVMLLKGLPLTELAKFGK